MLRLASTYASRGDSPPLIHCHKKKTASPATGMAARMAIVRKELRSLLLRMCAHAIQLERLFENQVLLLGLHALVVLRFRIANGLRGKIDDHVGLDARLRDGLEIGSRVVAD